MAEGAVADPGSLPTEIRRAIYERARRRALGDSHPVPQEFESYIDKVTDHAYKVIDRDIDELRQAGHSEDTLFEVTVCTALGAGMARLDALRRALGEES